MFIRKNVGDKKEIQNPHFLCNSGAADRRVAVNGM